MAIATAAPVLAQDAETEDDGDLIVVTGSRIATDSTLTAASPVLAIGGDDIRTSGQIDITALLRESPALQGSLPGSFSAFNGGPLGTSRLNLRSLGTERTLVIEDGRRHVAGQEGTAAVDVNTISTALLERVDVLTGGASSIYGADAVSGVVNFIMRDGASFDGMEVRVQTGITDDGDAEEWFLSIANGFTFEEGRGSMVFALEYQGTELVTGADRDFAGSGQATLIPDFASSPFSNVYAANVTLPISSGFGVIALDDNGFGNASAFVETAFFGANGPGCRTVGSANIPTCQVVDNGVLRPYNPGDIFVDAFNAVGGDAVPVLTDDTIILPETDRILFQTNTDYSVNDFMSFFVDTKYSFTRTIENNQVNGFNDDIPIALDNPFIPDALAAQVQSLIDDGLDPSIGVSRDVLDISARSNPIAERKLFRIVGGFEGQLPVLGFDYEVSYNFGRTDADITSRQRIEDRYFAAIDAVEDPTTGEIVCRSELDTTDPATYAPPTSIFPAQNDNFGISTFVPGDGQCVPINILGLNSISQEGADFIYRPTTSQNTIEQRVFLATVTGDTEEYFSLPAGPIGFAVGFENREEESAFQPDSFSNAGLTFGTLESRGGITRPSFGVYEVSEGFIEYNVPLLADLPGVKYLEFRGSNRWSNYTTTGTANAWSYGGRYQPFEGLTLRTTFSRAVRSPNIGELFAPLFTVTLGADEDPCNPQFIDAGSEFRRDNCAILVGPALGTDPGAYNSTNFLSAFVPGVSGGNPDLNEEVADTFTIGGVWQPSGFLEGLTVNADYYSIEIEGLIDTLDGFDIAQNCVDLPTLNNQFCTQIDRDPTDGFITGFRSGQINLAAVETAGVDWRVIYEFEMPTLPVFGFDLPGDMRFAANGTRFLKYDETRDVSAPDAVTDVLRTTGLPEWIVNFSSDWTIGDFVFGWRGRYESSQLTPGIEPEDLVSNPNFSRITETGSALVSDFSASYFVRDDLEIYGGINNAFEAEPFIAQLSRPAGPRGRFLFVGVNVTF
ncbi:MAG: TonB-dependent receptor [Pseudomonadota bacterium]